MEATLLDAPKNATLLGLAIGYNGLSSMDVIMSVPS